MPQMHYGQQSRANDDWITPFYISGAVALIISLCGLVVTVLRIVMLILDKEEITIYDVMYSFFAIIIFIWKMCTVIYALFNASNPKNLTPMRGYFTICMYAGATIDLILILIIAFTLVFMSKPDYKEIIIITLIIILVFLILSAVSFCMACFALLQFVPALKTMDYPYMQIMPRFYFDSQMPTQN